MGISDFFSGVALVVAIIGLYFQFWHRRDEIVCSLIGHSVSRNDLNLRLALSNAGTRPILLLKAELKQLFVDKNGGGVGYALTDGKDAPSAVLIPQHDIRVIEIPLKVDDRAKTEVAQHFANMGVQESERPWPIWLELEFLNVSGRKLLLKRELSLASWTTTGEAKLWTIKRLAWRIRPSGNPFK